jgi:predicted metal-dependent TIM-barrel fold hydrolase
MDYIDHHAHMSSRTTDDYEQMALTGCRVLTEPAFWAGYDRGSCEAFAAYFEALTDFEPKRAAKYGIQHYTWLSLNPKEADDRALAATVLPLIPRYLDRPNVLGLGEIGLNRVTRNEVASFEEQVDLAVRYDHQLIMIHTPHLEDKLKGTRVIVESLKSDARLRPERVLVDHAEEHTLPMIKERGYWAGLTLYPQTKVSPQRAADMVEVFGSDRILVASACDWGPSVPWAVAHFIREMRRRAHPDKLIRKIVWDNPCEFLGQSPKFRVPGGESETDRSLAAARL